MELSLARAVREAGEVLAGWGGHVGLVSRVHVPRHINNAANNAATKPSTHIEQLEQAGKASASVCLCACALKVRVSSRAC